MATSLNTSGIDTRFHAVYLLTSCDPRYRLHYYVGYTTHPLRRLRQHNGDLQNGAWRTAKKGRPWRIVLFVSGFTEDRAGLRFEWMWQNPHRAIATRDAVQPLTLTRLPFAVAVLHLLLASPAFSNMALSLNIMDQATYDGVKNAAHTAGVPAPAASSLLHIRVVTDAEVEAMVKNDAHSDADDDAEDAIVATQLCLAPVLPPPEQQGLSLASSPSAPSTPSRLHRAESLSGAADDTLEAAAAERVFAEERGLIPCTLCCLAAPLALSFRCTATRDCPMRCHVACLAMWFYAHAPPTVSGAAMTPAAVAEPAMPTLVPVNPAPCPVCAEALFWPVLIQRLRLRMNRREAQVIEGRRAMMEQRRALLRALEASGSAKKRTRARRAGGVPSPPSAARSRTLPTATPPLTGASSLPHATPIVAPIVGLGATPVITPAADDDWLLRL